MTKKDYELIAGAIARSRASTKDLAEVCAIEYTAQCIATELEKENTRFNPARFLNACK